MSIPMSKRLQRSSRQWLDDKRAASGLEPRTYGNGWTEREAYQDLIEDLAAELERVKARIDREEAR